MYSIPLAAETMMIYILVIVHKTWKSHSDTWFSLLFFPRRCRRDEFTRLSGSRLLPLPPPSGTFVCLMFCWWLVRLAFFWGGDINTGCLISRALIKNKQRDNLSNEDNTVVRVCDQLHFVILQRIHKCSCVCVREGGYLCTHSRLVALLSWSFPQSWIFLFLKKLGMTYATK